MHECDRRYRHEDTNKKIAEHRNKISEAGHNPSKPRMRVKLSWILSTVGTSASLFITVTRLIGRDMPTECDMLVVEAPGLCIG